MLPDEPWGLGAFRGEVDARSINRSNRLQQWCGYRGNLGGLDWIFAGNLTHQAGPLEATHIDQEGMVGADPELLAFERSELAVMRLIGRVDLTGGSSSVLGEKFIDEDTGFLWPFRIGRVNRFIHYHCIVTWEL